MNRACCATAKTAFKKVTHVIFDLDGLLLDTEILYTQATNNVVQQYGQVCDWSLKSQIMGLKGDEAAKMIVEMLDLPITWEEYYALAHEQYNILMPNAELMPDTEGVYRQVISDIARKFGKIYTPEIRVKLLGTVETDTAAIAVRELQLPVTTAQFLDDFRHTSSKLLTSCPFMPGAEKLVRHLHKNKIPIAVATSSSQQSLDMKTAKYGELFSLFHHKVAGGSDPEVKRGKPSPDIFLVCASRFPDQPKPEQCLVLEDAPNGVTAAVDAGMQCIWVPDAQINRDGNDNATVILKTLEEVKPELFGLPAFNGL